MSRIKEVFEKNGKVFQLTPTWIPRVANQPGRRLRLHPDDYYPLGMARGGICERWLGSVNPAKNGPNTPENEGMSYILLDAEKNEKVFLNDAIKELGTAIIGEELMNNYGTWPTFAKIYDYEKPLPHHIHMKEEVAMQYGFHGKPEAYYFLPQYNASYLGHLPLTYFGFDPSTTKEEVKECIRNFDKFDNRITELSRAYRIQLGTGWYTAAGVIHGPASVVTYEPQWNSETMTVYENLTDGEVNLNPRMTGDLPAELRNDVDAVFNLIDWEESVRCDYKETYFRKPKERATDQKGLTEKWVTYANPWLAAKEITVEPNCEVVVKDAACYCAVVVQGYGEFGAYACEAPGLLRYGQNSGDEFFVSIEGAKDGVRIKNNSSYEPLVILQNFANDNKEAPATND